MGDFSRDTYSDEEFLNRLKRYVGVRLQEGVPLIDADWNEQEDIRKFEVQAFLKWYVGNGVPKGNDGFRIMPVKDKIILSSKKDTLGISSVQVIRNDNEAADDAADILGFGPNNCSATRMAPPAAQLIGENAAKPKDDNKVYFDFGDGKTLKIAANGSDPVIIKLSGLLTPEVVADKINNVQKFLPFKAEAGKLNDFIIKGPIIKGPDGPLTGPGRCLVEGWDVINETDRTYSSQGLDSINILSGPRTDTVYLDVWEREVDSNEDPDLIDNRIGIETCVRLKREWVVRVAQGKNFDPSAGHVYYDLARLNWKKGEMEIQDLRRKGLAILSEEVTIEDGNVGIGTTDPETKLHVNGEILLDKNLFFKDTGGVNQAILRLDKNNDVTLWNPIGGVNDDIYLGTGSIEPENIRMVVKGNGDIGIGTTEPETKLEVATGSAKFVTSDGTNPLIISRFHRITDTQGQQELRVGVGDDITTLHYINDESLNRLNFRMQNTDTENGGGADANDNIVMCIKGDKDGGKVGIGTTSPREKLHVEGNIYSTGRVIGNNLLVEDQIDDSDSKNASFGSDVPWSPVPRMEAGYMISIEQKTVIFFSFNIDKLTFYYPQGAGYVDFRILLNNIEQVKKTYNPPALGLSERENIVIDGSAMLVDVYEFKVEWRVVQIDLPGEDIRAFATLHHRAMSVLALS